MTVRASRLANGFSVMSDAAPHLESACVGVWVNCGTRFETKSEMGISHMLEHMAFKGTARRSARAISEEIEAVGGDLNAYTAREQTGYHARVLKGDVDLALDILADILVHPAFTPSEIERECEVILQELGQTRDTADDLVFEHLQEACFPGQPMGWSILGDEVSVPKIRHDDLVRYMAEHYRGEAMALIATGTVDHEALHAAAERLFGGLAAAQARDPLPARFGGGDIRDVSKLEQAHLAFGFPSVASADPDLLTAQVFATALGGGTSSRLFQEAREKRGLCYAITAFASAYRDAGTISIYSGTSEANAGEIAPIIAGEIAAMAENANAEEVRRAKAQLKASLLMGMESPYMRCEQIAAQWNAYGHVLTTDEMVRRIEAIHEGDVRRFASRIARGPAAAIAAVGPVKKLESQARFQSRFSGARGPMAVDA